MTNPNPDGNATQKKRRATVANIARGSRIMGINVKASGVLVGKSRDDDGTWQVALEDLELEVDSRAITLEVTGVVVLPLNGQRLPYCGVTEKYRKETAELYGEAEADKLIADQLAKARSKSETTDTSSSVYEDSADSPVANEMEVEQ